MLLGNALADLFGGLVNELHALPQGSLAVLLIAAGIGCLFASRRRAPKHDL